MYGLPCRYILLPQMIICSLLLLTRGISHFTAQLTSQVSSSLVMSDVFILTTVEKLIAVGYNAHLIIFFTTRRSRISYLDQGSDNWSFAEISILPT